MFRKGLSVEEIASLRNLKQGTVWDHLAKLIQYNQLSVTKVLPTKKILQILQHLASKDDKLKAIKERLKDEHITYNEINCILASVKARRRSKRKKE